MGNYSKILDLGADLGSDLGGDRNRSESAGREGAAERAGRPPEEARGPAGPTGRDDDDALKPARGAVFGVALGGALWAAILWVVL